MFVYVGNIMGMSAAATAEGEEETSKTLNGLRDKEERIMQSQKEKSCETGKGR